MGAPVPREQMETQLPAADRRTPDAPVLPARTEVIQLRAKNQLTLPEAIAREIGAEPGDRFRAWVEPDGTVVLRKSVSLAGKYPGMWGDTDEAIAAHLRELRDEWERDRPWY